MTDESNIQEATIVREIKLPEFGSVHGVTCDKDGNVWFAHGDGDLICVEPASGRVLRQFPNIGAVAGTAFDGTHLWQVTKDRILKLDPETGEEVHSVAIPEGRQECSGMAWADGVLWIGRYRAKELLKVDPNTGEVLKTLQSDRLVTGVSYVDGELWYGAWNQSEDPVGAELRKVDPDTGGVETRLRMPENVPVSGLEADDEGRFWCGGC